MFTQTKALSTNPTSIRRVAVLVLVAMLVVSTLQVEPVEAGQKSDLIFVKGKFIKKDKKGVIVVEEKSHSCGCHGRR